MSPQLELSLLTTLSHIEGRYQRIRGIKRITKGERRKKEKERMRKRRRGRGRDKE